MINHILLLLTIYGGLTIIINHYEPYIFQKGRARPPTSYEFSASGRELVRPQGDRRIALGDQRRLGAPVGLRLKRMGKPRENQGKPGENQGKPCITRQKSRGSSSCVLHFPRICL